MSKLMRIREFLPLPAAAAYLSHVLQGNVTDTELFALAHEEKLRLSVGFPRRIWTQPIQTFNSAVDAQEAGMKQDCRLYVERLCEHAYAGEAECRSVTLDLSMLGGERELLQNLAWGQTIDSDAILFDEIILRDSRGNLHRPGDTYYEEDRPQLLAAFEDAKATSVDELAYIASFDPNRFKFRPWFHLPSDATWCVRVMELNRLIDAAAEQSFDGIATSDPLDLPYELDAANIAFRAVMNGHGGNGTTFKNRLIAYLRENYDFKEEALQRIATVANPDKSAGRKRRSPQ